MGDSNASDEKALMDRIKIVSDIADGTDDRKVWDELIGLLHRLIELAPLDSAGHGIAVLDLCNAIGKLYTLTRDIVVWQQGLDIVEQWQRVVPLEDWRAPLYMLAQAVLFYWRAVTTHEDEDAQAAIGMLERARSRVVWGSGVYCTASTYLADLRLQRFIQTGRPVDLEATIAHASDVVQAPRAQPQEALLCLERLSQALTLRDQLGVGSTDDLDMSVEFAQAAIELAPQGRGLTEPYMLRASALSRRFRHGGDPNDLDLAIASYAHALEAAGTDAQVKAGILNNYGNALEDRFDLTGRMEDLKGAIDASRSALALLPSTSPRRARTLCNLGISLLEEYRATGNSPHLEEAIAVVRAGLSATQAEPDVKARLEGCLGRALLMRASASASPHELLDEALNTFDRARELLDTEAAPVPYLLGLQETWGTLVEEQVGALLWRATLAGKDAPRYLRRALIIGEGVKSSLLTKELMHIHFPAPPGIPDDLVQMEQVLLTQLRGLDAAELTPSGSEPWFLRERQMERRTTLRRDLDKLWGQMLEASPEATANLPIHWQTGTHICFKMEAA